MMTNIEEDYSWTRSCREHRLRGHLGSVLRGCPHLKRLTTQTSILLGVTHDPNIALLDVLPLVDKLFIYLGDGPIKAGLKHLVVDSQASQGGFGVDLPGEIRVSRYDENEWVKLKELVLSNDYDLSYDQNIVWINTLKDPCEQLIREIFHDMPPSCITDSILTKRSTATAFFV